MRLLVDPTLRRRAAQRSRRSPSPALPAAGLLLRDVRAGRADPQRPRPVRADDVGADRQQRDLGRRCCWSTWSSSARPRAPSVHGGFTSGQELLLGLGSTLGIVAQFADPGAVPAPRRLPLPAALRLPRHRPRPHAAARRLDGAVRDRQPDRLHRRASGSPPAARPGRRDGTGYTVYSSAFLIVMVPHSIVTVSLATAILPRLSAHAAAERPARRWPARWRARCAPRSP